MMKFILCLIFAISFLAPAQANLSFSGESSGQMVAKYKAKKRYKSKRRRRSRKRRSTYRSRRSKREFLTAMNLVKAGDYENASIKLFKLVNSPSYKDKRLQIRYILGLMLYKMNLNQVSAFQFIHVIKQGRNPYLKQSIEKLSLAADSLGDDTLLDYAISRVKLRDFPRSQRDMLLFRIGEQQFRSGKYRSAAANFAKIQEDSSYFAQARYHEGMSLAYLRKNRGAIAIFEDLINSRDGKPVTDKIKVAAKLAKARVYYQNKQWDESVAQYKQVPRDTDFWHDTVFESSWAMMRSGRFRSALSNFQTLHSVYYENFYLPESLILRSIVYLYICKYEEMQKVLNLFNKVYRPIYRDVKSYLKYVGKPINYYQDVEKGIETGFSYKAKKYGLPKQVLRKVSREGDFKRSHRYIQKIKVEQAELEKRSENWQKSSIGRYAKKVLKTRLTKAKQKAGRQVRAHLVSVRSELFDLFEQEGFVRVEQINSKREAIKKRVAGKDLADARVDGERDRNFYIQNGYEYWPFRGEYWLDELGNYHYVGTHSCN